MKYFSIVAGVLATIVALQNLIQGFITRNDGTMAFGLFFLFVAGIDFIMAYD